MNLYIFQQGSPNCSVLFVCLFVRFYAIQKKTRDFVWVVVQLLLYKRVDKDLKSKIFY